MKLLTFIFLLFISINCHAQTAAADNIKDQLTPLDISKVKVGGEIGRRINITITNNILRLNTDKDFISSFQTKNNGGYIGMGKHMDCVARMAAYSNNEQVKSLNNHIVQEIIKAQQPDGYIGNMTPDNRLFALWDIHETGYIIFGLITNYKLFDDKNALAAAEKAAGHLMKNWSTKPAGWQGGIPVSLRVGVTGLHRTMFTLYEVTKNQRYLDFCLKELDLKNQDPGIIIGRKSMIDGHVYAYMATALGQLELYRLMPDPKLLSPATKALHFMISENGMTSSGAAGLTEIWTKDQEGRGELGESCATAYQMRIYDNLLRLRADSRFGDVMERTIYNTLFGAQSPDGRQIRYYTPMEGNRVYHHGDTYCCPNNFRRAIAELPGFVYYRTENGFAINLYSPSSAEITLDKSRQVKVSQETDYPNSGHVAISINPSEETTFALQLRIPLWCRSATISINGTQSEVKYKPGTFAVINRSWKANDKVEMEMPMEWRLVAGRERQSGRVAVMRGPLLFCLNPAQDAKIAKMDGADLGHMIIDKASIEPKPVPNDSVHPNGIACKLKAGNCPAAIGNSANLNLILTEFPDPDGKCTYFSVPDLSEAVQDELLGIW